MTTRIEQVLFAPGLGGFFNDDQVAIRNGARRDGEFYIGEPVTPGFKAIRVPAETLGIGLQLDDGCVVWGDMMSVQYAGVSGRDALLKSRWASEISKKHLVPELTGLEVRGFKEAMDRFSDLQVDGRTVHAGILYGLSQALLQTAAHGSKQTMAEQLCEEYGRPTILERVPVYAQSGDQRAGNVDKMIMKGVDVLPHGLINNREKFGADGEVFAGFLCQVVERIRKLGGSAYHPVLYFDLYGMPGIVFNNDIEKIADYLVNMGELAAPHTLRIESPAIFDSLEEQVAGFASIRARLRKRGSRVEIAVDEWCNTLDDIEAFIDADAADLMQIKMPDMGGIDRSLEAIERCQAAGMKTYLGGSCTETDLSARVATHVALAMQVDMFLARPGMGVDEALTIVGNEQARTLAQVDSRRTGS